MSRTIDKRDFELASQVFSEHFGEVMQYIADDFMRHIEFNEDLARVQMRIANLNESELKFKIWRTCDCLEIFLPYFKANDYWRVEEALDKLWSDKDASGWLHSFDLRAVISSLVTNFWLINKNVKKKAEKMK